MTTRPEDPAAAPGRGRLRASHADREHVIDTVRTAFADGRLDKDELDARVGQTLAARTYADLATATAGIPAGPAQAPPPRRAGAAVNKGTAKWGLAAAGAITPPAMFVAGAYGVWWLVFPAFPLLFIELIVTIIAVAITLANRRDERWCASRG